MKTLKSFSSLQVWAWKLLQKQPGWLPGASSLQESIYTGKAGPIGGHATAPLPAAVDFIIVLVTNHCFWIVVSAGA